MGLYTNRPTRFAIPRWRDFKETSNSGELSKGKNIIGPKSINISCKKQLENWKTKPSIGNALELVNSAFVSNEKVLAEDAAKFILQNCNDNKNPIIKIAQDILKENKEDKVGLVSSYTFETLDDKIKVKIREIRKRLKVFPSNPVLWIDYARWHTVIGKFSNAERSIKTAIQLAPTNVFVLRCAVRFFIHKSKHDIYDKDSITFALQLIRKNPATKFDPWLMATEISLCSYLQKTSNLMKAGFTLIEAKNFSSFELAELTSALATVELYHSSSKSKKLFNQSLVDPNENSIAQAQWASNIVGDLPVNLTLLNSHEASSYQNQFLEKWDDSFDSALNWLVDEPFSCEPAKHASYIAAALIDNNPLSIEICNIGLRSNPNEFALLNNKAYSQAVENQIEEAEKTFNKINSTPLNDNERAVYFATKGLIHYRNGDIEAGSALYDQAEALAKKNRDEILAFRVRLHKTRAEFICDCSKVDEQTAITRLMNEVSNFKRPDLSKAMDNLKKRLFLK